jgi:predicted nucleic acid-binding protein
VIFLDTSALVKPYLRETGADAVTALLKRAHGEIYISTHVTLEVVATFAYKYRDRQLTSRGYRRLRRDFLADLPGAFQVLPVDEETLDRALLLSDQHFALGVGSLDLLHVATAMHLQVIGAGWPVIVTSDRAMRNLAAAAGFEVFDPETDDPERLISLN